MKTQCVESVQSGDTFYAVKGVHTDGATLVPLAIQRGAVKIVADHFISCAVPVEVVPDVRRAFAKDVAQDYPGFSLKKVLVTGTNGKTSTVYFVQQLMNLCGHKAVSLGTIGQDGCWGHQAGHMTTLSPEDLSKTLFDLEQKGTEVVALEASSHGLDQGRLCGHHFDGGAFTNLTRDHLDYHQTMENYFRAKAHLFDEVLGADGVAVLNADIPEYPRLKEIAQSRHQKIISYGRRGETLTLKEQHPTLDGQKLLLVYAGKEYPIDIKIYGDFQAMNLLAAIGLCMSLGESFDRLVAKLPLLRAPAGRLEAVGKLKNGATVFVDYAHTPDGLEQVLKSLRQHTQGRLVCLFGCGGNRDTGKRPQMGKIASDLADDVFITDDNPRMEDPQQIRLAILAACPKGHQELNRRVAIFNAINSLQKNDVLVLAGKGHEEGQEIQGKIYPFNDKLEAEIVLKTLNESPLWRAAELQQALGVGVENYLNAWEVVFNSQQVKVGSLFVALTGGARDGHDFVQLALEKGAAACLVSHEVKGVFPDRLIQVPNTRLALDSLARFARMRTQAQVVGITGSCGKTTVKEMLASCLSRQGQTHATPDNLNNDLGVALTLANLPRSAQYAVIEMGISHAGEMTHLSDLVRPNVSVITNVSAAHQEFFKTLEITATEKAHIMDYQDKNGTIVLPTDSPCASQLLEKAHEEQMRHIVRFGKKEGAEFCLEDLFVQHQKMQVSVAVWGEKKTYPFHFLGEHYALDSLAVLAATEALGASWEQALMTLGDLMPVSGRGKVFQGQVNGKKITVIDDAYNANPSSVVAGLKMLSLYAGRKIAVLGDMLELGPQSTQRHLDLLENLTHNGPDKVYAVGTQMKQVFDLLNPTQKGAWAETPEALFCLLSSQLQNKDVVWIKSSHGMGLYRLVEKLKGTE